MFQVGQKVTIHPDLASFNRGEHPHITGEMLKLAGAVRTITYVGGTIRLQNTGYGWLPKWLIPQLSELDQIQSQSQRY